MILYPITILSPLRMLIPVLFAFVANLTTYAYPPLAKAPLVQLFQTPLTRGALPFQGVSPECSWNPLVSEGEVVSFGTNVSILCRDTPDSGTTNQSFTIQQRTYNPVENAWGLTQTLGQGQPMGANMGSAGLKFAQAPTGEIWGILQTGGGASGGTAGNGGTTTLWYFPAPGDPAGGWPSPIIDSTKGTTFLDLQMTPQGLYALARRAPRSPGVSLQENGITFWPSVALPKRQLTDIVWLPGTNSSRLLSSFFVSQAIDGSVILWINSVLTPVTVEQWRLDLQSGMWSPTLGIGAPTHTSPLTQMINYEGSLVLMSQRGLSYLSLGPTGWTDIQIQRFVPGGPLQYKGIASGFVDVRPTPTAVATVSSSGSASSSATTTGSPSSTSTSSATSSSSSSVSSTTTATLSMSAQTSLTPTTTLTPSPTLLVSPSLTPSRSLTPSISPNAPDPAAIATGLTPQQELGLGFGVTTGFILIVGILLGCFARHAVFRAYLWMKQHLIHKKPKRPPTRLSAVMPPAGAPGVVHLSMNPALLQQQSALELLQMAREQRLEAIQMQKEQVSAEAPRLDRLKSFKKVYKPIMIPGASV